MQVQDVINLERLLLNDPNANGRWSNTSLTLATSRGLNAVIGQTMFPESRFTTVTVANVQEYSVPEMFSLLRVYINGQPIAPTSVDTLEGIQTLTYDQTGQGVDSQGAAQGGTVAQPQWAVQTPVAYPFLTNYGAPVAIAAQSFPGQSPRFYWRGGVIGFVPAPLVAGAIITLDCVAVPPQLVNLSDQLFVPLNFLDAIAYRACEYCKLSDDDDRAADQRNYFGARFEKEIRTLRTWSRNYKARNDGPFPLTYRNFYQKGNNRVSFSSSADDWGGGF